MTKLCLAAGCALAMTFAASAPTLAGQLTQTEWRPVKIGDVKLTSVKPFVRFDEDGALAGHGGCNSFRGKYKLAGSKIEITKLAVTLMACLKKDTMSHEALFLRAIRQAKTFKRDGTSLVMSDSSHQPIAEFIERH